MGKLVLTTSSMVLFAFWIVGTMVIESEVVPAAQTGTRANAPKNSDDWYRRQPNDNEAYFAFGQPVYAAGAGRVVDVHDGEADNRRVNPLDFTKRETAGGGNYVVIDHQNGEFSWFRFPSVLLQPLGHLSI